MEKKKITLSELKVQSFVTNLDEAQMEKIKGGFLTIRGRRYMYKTRWTTVDTRSDQTEEDNGQDNQRGRRYFR
jgi:hypothetical protein